MKDVVKKYMVCWTWKEEDTEEGIKKYEEMEKNKRADSKIKEISRRKYPTSHGSSHGGGDSPPAWFTIFEATEDQLKNWLDHYEPVLQVTNIKSLMSADEFIEKYRNGEITWKYWYSLK